MLLKDIIIVKNPIKPPIKINFKGYVPTNLPFSKKILLGLMKYKSANVTPPKVNDVK